MTEKLLLRVPYNFVSQQTKRRFHKGDVVFIKEMEVVTEDRIKILIEGEHAEFEMRKILLNCCIFVQGAKQLGT